MGTSEMAFMQQKCYWFYGSGNKDVHEIGYNAPVTSEAYSFLSILIEFRQDLAESNKAR